MIKEYFFNYFLHNSDLTIELKNNKIEVHKSDSETFKVTLVDTGLMTKTAGRLQKIEKFLDGQDFMLTYGDGVSNIDIKKLLEFHKQHGKIATVTAVQPEARFGGMEVSSSNVVKVFKEKPKGDKNWINGGFFVLKSEVFDYLKQPNIDDIMWEDYPLEKLSQDSQLVAYQHQGFWKCMDALRDKMELENLWETGNAEWKVWK